MPIGFLNRRAPRATPTPPLGATAPASAPDRLSTTARQMPFSAKSTTRNPSQTKPCALRKSNVDTAVTSSATIKKGLRQPIRSDQSPIGN